ncbi:hypothetical protein [Candidatus Thiothrix anitrata]|uniref:Uncharacterized protein n=1 Tax=Candidatus Thiothrix anitrata TaxID=2823902 RepID=A0ABX7X8F9_9GAMM|nr:hypothetical protein [Candidatus Thiothrix anitrata]QTR51505.1 hypothetical protein J8380_08180 [Candidatus Thiothrix anitrata]
MNTLTTALKTVLNGLAMQYEGELLTTEEKKANLQRVLANIEREQQQQIATSKMSVQPFVSNGMTLQVK